MPNGHIQDPRMKASEQGYGILTAEIKSNTSKKRKMLYLKDDISCHFTEGAKVTFEVQKWVVPYFHHSLIKGRLKLKLPTKFIEIEVATFVRAVEINTK